MIGKRAPVTDFASISDLQEETEGKSLPRMAVAKMVMRVANIPHYKAYSVGEHGKFKSVQDVQI